MLSSVCKVQWHCIYYHVWPLEIQFYTYTVYCVFCSDLTTNSDYFPILHWLIGFYNLHGVWLLCGTDWMCKYNSGEARVRSQVCTCEIYGGESGTGTGFSPSNSVFSCQYHSANAPYILIFIYMLLLSEGKRGEAWESSKNQCFFRNWGTLDWKVLSLTLYRVNMVNVCHCTQNTSGPKFEKC